MYESDIQLDEYGNSIIKDGEFGLSTDDREFILRMLVTTPQSWLMHPELGVGLEKYIGRFNDPALRSEMKSAIINFFKNYGLLPEVNIVKTGDMSIGCYIKFTNLFNDKYIEVTIAFNIENGDILFLNESGALTNTELVKSVKPFINRYLQRRYK